MPSANDTGQTQSVFHTPLYRLILMDIEAAGDSEVASVRVDELLTQALPSYWEMFADKGRIHPRLQYLYTLRAAIDFWQRSVWREVDFDEEVKESLRQKSLNLATIRAQTDADIAELVSQSNNSGGGAVGKPDIVGSLVPHNGSVIDPSAPRYRGDARDYLGRFRG